MTSLVQISNELPVGAGGISSPPFIEVLSTSGSAGASQPVLVRRGDATSFSVRVRGNPAPAVTWYIDRKPVLAADRRFRLESDVRGEHVLRVRRATEILDGGVWVVAGNDAGQDSTHINVKTYRVLSNLGTLDYDADAALLEGCRFHKRYYDIDDVIRNRTIDPCGSNDFHSLPRDARRIHREQPKRRSTSDLPSGRNQLRKSRRQTWSAHQLRQREGDSGLASVTVDEDRSTRDDAVDAAFWTHRVPTTAQFTEDVCEEVHKPVIPAMSIDPCIAFTNTYNLIGQRTPDKVRNLSVKITQKPSKSNKNGAGKTGKENRNRQNRRRKKVENEENSFEEVNVQVTEIAWKTEKVTTSSKKKKTKKKKLKEPEVISLEADKVELVGSRVESINDQGGGKVADGKKEDDGSLWDMNGGKLWMFCASLLRPGREDHQQRHSRQQECSPEIEIPVVERTAVDGSTFGGCDSALGDSVMSGDDVTSEILWRQRRGDAEGGEDGDETEPEVVNGLQDDDIGHFVDGRNLYTWLAFGGYSNHQQQQTLNDELDASRTRSISRNADRFTDKLTDRSSSYYESDAATRVSSPHPTDFHPLATEPQAQQRKKNTGVPQVTTPSLPAETVPTHVQQPAAVAIDTDVTATSSENVVHVSKTAVEIVDEVTTHLSVTSTKGSVDRNAPATSPSKDRSKDTRGVPPGEIQVVVTVAGDSSSAGSDETVTVSTKTTSRRGRSSTRRSSGASHQHKTLENESTVLAGRLTPPKYFIFSSDIDISSNTTAVASPSPTAERRCSDVTSGLRMTSSSALDGDLLRPTVGRRESGYSSLPRSSRSSLPRSTDGLAVSPTSPEEPRQSRRRSSCRSVQDLTRSGYKRRSSKSVEIKVDRRRVRSASRTRTRTLSQEWQLLTTTTKTEVTTLRGRKSQKKNGDRDARLVLVDVLIDAEPVSTEVNRGRLDVPNPPAKSASLVDLGETSRVEVERRGRSQSRIGNVTLTCTTQRTKETTQVTTTTLIPGKSATDLVESTVCVETVQDLPAEMEPTSVMTSAGRRPEVIVIDAALSAATGEQSVESQVAEVVFVSDGSDDSYEENVDQVLEGDVTSKDDTSSAVEDSSCSEDELTLQDFSITSDDMSVNMIDDFDGSAAMSNLGKVENLAGELPVGEEVEEMTAQMQEDSSVKVAVVAEVEKNSVEKQSPPVVKYVETVCETDGASSLGNVQEIVSKSTVEVETKVVVVSQMVKVTETLRQKTELAQEAVSWNDGTVQTFDDVDRKSVLPDTVPPRQTVISGLTGTGSDVRMPSFFVVPLTKLQRKTEQQKKETVSVSKTIDTVDDKESSTVLDDAEIIPDVTDDLSAATETRREVQRKHSTTRVEVVEPEVVDGQPGCPAEDDVTLRQLYAVEKTVDGGCVPTQTVEIFGSATVSGVDEAIQGSPHDTEVLVNVPEVVAADFKAGDVKELDVSSSMQTEQLTCTIFPSADNNTSTSTNVDILLPPNVLQLKSQVVPDVEVVENPDHGDDVTEPAEDDWTYDKWSTMKHTSWLNKTTTKISSNSTSTATVELTANRSTSETAERLPSVPDFDKSDHLPTAPMSNLSSDATHDDQVDSTSTPAVPQRPPSADGEGQVTLHDYGEMYSIFREIPTWIEMLRATVVDRHNNDPRISSLLARYPSLRPATWKWTSPPRVDDLRKLLHLTETPMKTGTDTADADFHPTESWSYDVEPVVERCLVVENM